jgi:hypothetical protein
MVGPPHAGVIRTLTPNDKSLIKARYFQTILRVAKTSDDVVAVRMLESLISENSTDGLGDEVRRAELAAIATVRKLSEGLRVRDGATIAVWGTASQAVTRWLALVG